MEILENDHRYIFGGDGFEERAELADQPRRLPRWHAAWRREIGNPRRQLRKPARRVTRQQLRDRRGKLSNEMMDRVDNRKIGVSRIGAFQTLAIAGTHRWQFRRVLQKGVAERRLARAPLSFDEYEPVFAPLNISQALLESGKLVAMVHENRGDCHSLWRRNARGRVGDRRQKGIALPRFASNELWILRIVAERAAQLAHQDLDVFRLHVRVRPHARQDLVVRDQRTGPVNETSKHAGGFASDIDLAGPTPQRAATPVETVGEKVVHAALEVRSDSETV